MAIFRYYLLRSNKQLVGSLHWNHSVYLHLSGFQKLPKLLVLVIVYCLYPDEKKVAVFSTLQYKDHPTKCNIIFKK